MSKLDEVKVFCVVDGVEVPPERKKRRSITCSDECAKKRNDYLRARKELRACKYCGNLSSEAERDEFRAWRRDRKVAARLAAKKAVTA
jgi:hypothetical protein